MSEQRSFISHMRKLLSAILMLSVLLCSLPIYINSAVNEDYDLPWLWPVPESYYINGLDYYYSGNLHTQGQCIDIGSNGFNGDKRLDVVSATNGEVFYIRNTYDETTNKGSGWGNYVIVKSGNVCIIYAHLQTVSCKYGEIKAGDVIGKMGSTGNATGVHLHMQAYPANASSSSTDIHAFDKYINNPLYVESFRFMSGVSQYSKRYGAHISKYYSAVSGSYNVYSGGYFGEYGETPLGAVVKSVRGSGARVYAKPSSSDDILRTVEFGTEITVYSYYTDAYGDKWYLVSPNTLDMWIPESDVGFYSYNFGAKYVDKGSPSGVYGTCYDLFFDGTVSVSHTIESVKAEIKQGNAVIASCEIKVGASSFDINNVFASAFGITDLADGNYTYELFVTETASFGGADKQSKTYSVFLSEFIIDYSFSENIPPLVEEIVVADMKSDSVSLSAVATDNKQVLRLEYVFTNASGFEKVFDSVQSGDKYTVTVPLSALNGSGAYTVTARVYDTNKNTDQTSIDIVFPSASKGEVYQIVTSSGRLNVRSKPQSTNSPIIDKLYSGDIVTVTEIYYNSAEGVYWGYNGTGWFSMQYANYQSGQLYNITLNLLCGKADFALVINKAFGADTKLPEKSPMRDGYTFMGWSTSPTSNEVKYRAGDTYKGNASIMLYAIWSDNTSPVINDVAFSTSDYVSDKVTLTVNASDGGATLYYSFDGGLSWRRSPSLTVTENQVIPAGTIKVKDQAGHIVSYDKEITVSNIDKDAPILGAETLGTSISGDSVKFTFGAASDPQSGVGKYTIVYSANSDFNNAVTVDAVSPHSIRLSDGVYYAKLIVADKVGNKLEIPFKRFLIGSPTKLEAPLGFVLKSSSSGEAVFEWSSVTNADSYSLIVSESSDFLSALTFETSSNSLSVTSLNNGKVYYAKLVASASDGVYLQSDATSVIKFETASSDNTLYSFVSLDRAEIDGNTASAEISYSSQTVDITCVCHEKATVKYYFDESLINPISDPTAFAFINDTASVYIVITSENGIAATYTLNLVRALRDADEPIVEHTPLGGTLYLGAFGQALSLNASVSDGGKLSVTWYVSRNGDQPAAVAEGNTYTPCFDIAGEYKVYAVVTNNNELCLNKTSSVTTEASFYTVLRNSSYIEVNLEDYIYNGSSPLPSYSSYNGDGAVTYKYFSDRDCTNEIAPPVNSGKYYIKAYASQTDKYDAAESIAHEFNIVRRENNADISYILVQPTLRERFGTLTVSSVGIEYSLNNGAYVQAEAGKAYRFDEGDVIAIRYTESENVSASSPIILTVTPFTGTDGFYPDATLDAKERDGHFVVNSHKLTASDLISKLVKKENVNIYSPRGELLNSADGFIYSGCTISIVDDIGVYKTLTVIILGDLDNDGIVTERDVRAVMMLSNGMSVPESELDNVIADLDGDGTVTSIDAAKAYSKTK